jgi:hypothetical protein
VLDSTSTPQPNADTTDVYELTAQAVTGSFIAPTGTPVEGQKLLIAITDNGSAQSLVFSSATGAYVFQAVPFPSITTVSTRLDLGFIYSTGKAAWVLVANTQAVGPTGPTGVTGTGPTGPTGPTGAGAAASANLNYMTATQNFATTITATFNQMTISITSGTLYRIKATIPVVLDNGNSNGFTLGFIFPAVKKCVIVGVSKQLGAAVAMDSTSVNLTPQGASATQIAVITSGTTVCQPIEWDGYIACTGSGNLMFYGRAETANATAKVLEGGNIIAWNLGTYPV